jgi:hypothetical protein
MSNKEINSFEDLFKNPHFIDYLLGILSMICLAYVVIHVVS